MIQFPLYVWIITWIVCMICSTVACTIFMEKYEAFYPADTELTKFVAITFFWPIVILGGPFGIIYGCIIATMIGCFQIIRYLTKKYLL
jgi:hypothetical protein